MSLMSGLASRKLAVGLPACRAAGVEFIPLMVETLGDWSSEAIVNLKKIGQSLGQRNSPTFPAETVKHLFGCLATALWRGNATLWLCRYPSLPPPSRMEWYNYNYNYIPIIIPMFICLFNCLILCCTYCITVFIDC